MTKRTLFTFLVLNTTLACASISRPSSSLPPKTETFPEQERASISRNKTENKSWTFLPATEPQSYRSVVRTTIEERTAPGTRRADFTTTTDYSLRLVRSPTGTDISGTVSAFQVQGDQIDRIVPTSSIGLPLVFEGRLTNHTVSLRTVRSTIPSTSLCTDSIETVLSSVDRDVIIIPLEISTIQSWQDSTMSRICNGSFPVNLVKTREYRITGETEVEGVAALSIERIEKINVAGEGTQGQHQIIVSGAGTGKGQIDINRMTGELLQITAKHQIEISIKSSGRTQTFLQNADEKTTTRRLAR